MSAITAIQSATADGKMGESNSSICAAAMMKARGFFGVGLISPKNPYNVGAVLRAAQCFGAAFVVTTGRRYQKASTNTMNAERHMPLFDAGTGDIFDHIPYDCEPVAVDLVEDAQPLDLFRHRARAFYIFGPEDGTLSKQITDRCASKVVIPSRFCLNLAASVNVVLYDRTMKQLRDRRRYTKAAA